MIKATILIKDGHMQRFEKLVQNFCLVNHDAAAAIIVDKADVAAIPKKEGE